MNAQPGQFTTIIAGARSMILGLVMMLAPFARASAAEPSAPSMPDVTERGAVVQAPDVELEALDATLNYDELRFARPSEAVGALTPPDRARIARSAGEAELDAMTAAARAENAAHRATSYAFARDGGRGGDVPAAEAELHALLAWEDAQHDAGSARAPQTDAVSQHARAVQSHGVRPDDCPSDAQRDAPSPGTEPARAARPSVPTSTDEAREAAAARSSAEQASRAADRARVAAACAQSSRRG